MTLGDILKQACNKDLAHNGKNGISYKEIFENDKMIIRLTSTEFPESFITCEIPYNGTEESANYLRYYFLSMLFNSSIYGMKRINKNKKTKR